MRSKKLHQSNKGFSLLEVIVALAVLAIGIAGVLRVFSSSIAAVKAADSYSTAAMLANRVATELDQESSLESGTQSGSFDDHSDYSWEANIGSSDDNDMIRILIVVRWGETSNKKSFSMVTYARSSSSSSESTTTSGGS